MDKCGAALRQVIHRVALLLQRLQEIEAQIAQAETHPARTREAILARLRQQVTLKMAEQATESEQLSRARFEAGVILVSDLIDSETRLTDARVRNAVATSAVEIAIADLRRATGLAPFPPSPNLTLSMENQ